MLKTLPRVLSVYSVICFVVSGQCENSFRNIGSQIICFGLSQFQHAEKAIYSYPGSEDPGQPAHLQSDQGLHFLRELPPGKK